MSDADELAALRARVSELEQVLNLTNSDKMATVFKLPPKLRSLFDLLMALDVVSADLIHRKLLIDTDAKVTVHRLRLHLDPWKLKIQSRRHIGYWFDEETKAKINKLVDDYQDDPPLHEPPTAVEEIPPAPAAKAA